MNIEEFIEKVTKIVDDSEFKQQLEKGLQIQLTITKDETKITALIPKNNKNKK